MNNQAESSSKKTVVWYAMHAYKQELKAHTLLTKLNIESFVPLHYTIRINRQGKKERRLEPAISNYIFVHSSREQIWNAKLKMPYLKYATRSGDCTDEKLIIIPEEQMSNFIKIASHHEEDLTYFRPEEIQLDKGTYVRVHGGIFDGVTGTLLRVKGKRSKRIVVMLDGIQAIAASEIHPDLIEVLPPTFN